MDNILFKIGTRARFDEIVNKDSSTLYWLSDTHELYKGDILYGMGHEATTAMAGLMSAGDKLKLDSLADGSSMAEYAIEKQETPNAGCAATYKLKKTLDGTTTYVGDDINLMENVMLQGGTVGTVTTADVPYDGAQVGDIYIDLTLNDDANTHIYIPANDMISEYVAGNGISISGHTVSLAIDDSNANGLSVSLNGLALALATESSAGAMSAEDKASLASAITDITSIKDSITWGTF